MAMLNIWPWKLLNRDAPVTKPGTDWVNAVTRVLSTLKIRFGDDLEIKRQDPNCFSPWEIVIPFPPSTEQAVVDYLTEELELDIHVTASVTGDGTELTPLKLVNDEDSPSAATEVHYYGTNPDGTQGKGWFNLRAFVETVAEGEVSAGLSDVTHTDVCTNQTATFANIAEHDGRYWKESSATGDPEDKSYHTEGTVGVGGTQGSPTVEISTVAEGGGLVRINGEDARLEFSDATAGVWFPDADAGTVQVLASPKELDAYTTDDESAAYTAQSTEDIAKLADLNALRAAYENLRAAHEDMRSLLVSHGMIKEPTP